MADEGGASLPNELVGAVVPTQILHEDEIVLVLAKPAIAFIFYTSFYFLVGAAVLGVAAAKLTAVTSTMYISPLNIAWITVAACVGRLIWALLVWTSHVYMLTNQRIVTIKGVMNVHMFQANLRKVQKTELFTPVVQRLLGTGTLGFATAAGGGGVESTWVMIARPVETQEQIIAAINKTQGR